MKRFCSTLILVALSACADSTAPGRTVARSQELVAGVSLSLTATPARVIAGQSIEIVATARNSTAGAIQIGTDCGPSMDVVLSGPRGYAASVLRLLNPSGAFTCELSALHFAPARGTQSVRLRVAAPDARGRYDAVAGLRRSAGLSNLSAAIAFEVR